ncbi:spiroplasma plectrovirus-related protein [Spiroplasma phoeniceum P40]|uniref:Spiroplasma plectrovirus-related protein n=2 Tax=Spiroplasma phoeniceum TaxID=47835 RepID=A0A345DPX5_9MOLU|nr:spiroplasma plectrovirus-related protein [Spiroplasma phoeniceum P40]
MLKQENSTGKGINETDFINTMFLRSSFFENWSETNYFINPTLKTSKNLLFNDKWYLDFLQDSYSTGVVYDKPDEIFLNYYRQWHSLKSRYMVEKFYDVKKENFLDDLTDFIYAFAVKYKMFDVSKQIVENVDRYKENRYPRVKLKQDNWKLICKNNFDNEFSTKNNKSYLFLNLFDVGKYGIYLSKNNGNISQKRNNIWYLETYNPKDFVMFNTANIKSLYRWVGDSEPQIPTIDKNTGEIIDWNSYQQNRVKEFISLSLYSVLQENIRVQKGGSADYENPNKVVTKRIIFDFETVDELGVKNIKKAIYRMILTVDEANLIISGSLELNNINNDDLSFNFIFMRMGMGEVFNFNGSIYSSLNSKDLKYYQQFSGQFDLSKFLQSFFGSALVPVFQNRSSFIENGYIDNLQYDTVLVNFFALKLQNFNNILLSENINDKLQFDKLLNSMFKISQKFYTNYLRTIFDLENNTYVQGYNKKYGLLVNNGFKIYPRYFYFSDKYKQLDIKLYSAFKNRFYTINNYGSVFNYDFSVANNYDIKLNSGYVFGGDLQNKYGLQYKKIEEQKIGYNVFELQAQKENDMYRYYDFNFGIYNWQEINNGGLFPDKQWFQVQYITPKGWWDFGAHIKNAVIWIVNTIPGVKQVNELASGVGKVFETVYSFFSQIFEVWKFNPALYSTITNIFLLIIFMKFVRLI